MARTLLYYPTFKLPSNQWLKNSLLYWDEVGTIVPENFFKEVAENKTIRYLSDEGIYKRFEPREVIQDYTIADNMHQDLVRRLDSQEFSVIKRKTNDNELFSIEFDKMFYSAWEELRERNLTDSDFDGSPILLKMPAALLYMGVLAKYLSIKNIDDYVQPSTSLELYEDLVFKGSSDMSSIDSIAMTLKRIIPKVHEDTSVRKIIEFKQQRRDELLMFRALLNDIQESLSQCSSQEDAIYQITKCKEQIEIGVSTIRRQLSENKIKNFVGTLRTIFSVKSPAWLGMLAGGGVGAPTALAGNTGVAIASTTLGLMAGAAIEIANYRVGAQEKIASLKRESPYSYLYFAQAADLTQD
jgi:hypothetical protein